MNILDKIIEHKKREVEEAKKRFPIKPSDLKSLLPIRDFKKNIKKSSGICLIAEIKSKSPSYGVIREEFNPIFIAKQYEKAGASALSVLTDKEFFGGDISHIMSIKEVTTLPKLRKHFIIDEYQIYESVTGGADAILLISDLLSEEELQRFISIAEGFEIDTLVEVHSEEDIRKATGVGSQIIGINNRDLDTGEVNLDTTSRLIRYISEDRITVSESGIKSYEALMYLKSLGVNAVLIGEAFMEVENIPAKMKEIMGI